MVSHCQALASSFKWKQWLNLTQKIWSDHWCWTSFQPSDESVVNLEIVLVITAVRPSAAGPYGNVCYGMRVCIRTKSTNCVIPLSRDCGGAVGTCEDQSSIMYAWGRNAPSTKLPRGNYSLSLSEICCYWSVSGRTLSDSLFHSLLYCSNKNRTH